MSIIYTPAGKAREYSPLAANLYSGCNHGCKYCYCPRIFYKTREEWIKNLAPRRNILRDFEKDCKKYTRSKVPVQFSFTTDPYNSLDSELRLTREALKLCLKYQIPVSILTKSADVLKDFDVIKKFGQHIKVGFTLTFSKISKSQEWEPAASLPADRLLALDQLHKIKVPTWASFEPVIEPDESMAMIEKTLQLECVDLYKVGKLNNYKGLDKNIDWKSFLNNCRILFEKHKHSKVYYKKDLMESADEVYYNNQDDLEIVESW